MSVSTNSLSQDLLTLNKAEPQYQAEPGEDYMNQRQKAYLRGLLQKERDYWANQQQNVMVDLQKGAERAPSDKVDAANRETTLSYRVRGREDRMLKKIDDALSRLEAKKDQYGFCTNCRAEIGIKRLEVRPMANLCVDCKTLEELRKKQSS